MNGSETQGRDGGNADRWRKMRREIAGKPQVAGGISWCGGEAVHRPLAEEMQKKVFDTLTSHNEQIDKMSKAITILINSDKDDIKA